MSLTGSIVVTEALLSICTLSQSLAALLPEPRSRRRQPASEHRPASARAPVLAPMAKLDLQHAGGSSPAPWNSGSGHAQSFFAPQRVSARPQIQRRVHLIVLKSRTPKLR